MHEQTTEGFDVHNLHTEVHIGVAATQKLRILSKVCLTKFCPCFCFVPPVPAFVSSPVLNF